MEELKEITINIDNSTFNNRNEIKNFVGKFLKIVSPGEVKFKRQYGIFPFLFSKDNEEFFVEELHEGFYICYDVVTRGEHSFCLTIDVIEHVFHLGKRLNEDVDMETSDEVLEYLFKNIQSSFKRYQKNVVIIPSWSETISACGYFGGRISFDIEVKYGRGE